MTHHRIEGVTSDVSASIGRQNSDHKGARGAWTAAAILQSGGASAAAKKNQVPLIFSAADTSSRLANELDAASEAKARITSDGIPIGEIRKSQQTARWKAARRVKKRLPPSIEVTTAAIKRSSSSSPSFVSSASLEARRRANCSSYSGSFRARTLRNLTILESERKKHGAAFSLWERKGKV